jgi:very-short-patch-repair endonuclease
MGAFRDGRINHDRSLIRSRLLPERVEALLAAQQDVVGRWQLREQRLSARAINRLLDAGLLRALPGRVLTTRRAPLDAEAMRWSALLSAGPGARLTGPSVLALAGIRERAPDDVHVLVSGEAPRRCAGVRRHRTNHLPPEDCRLWSGLPGTTVARALVDAAADSTADELAEDLDRAVMLQLFDEAALDRAMRARPRLQGNAKLRTALATLDEHSGQFRSTFERKVTRLVQQSAVIGPVVLNQLVEGFRPDILAVGTRAILECDGRDYHRSLAQIAADEAREARLEAMGFVILRIRWGQLRYEPERTLARIEQFVLANSAPPVPAA